MDLVVEEFKSESLLSPTYNASSRKVLLGSQNPTQWTHTPFFERVVINWLMKYSQTKVKHSHL